MLKAVKSGINSDQKFLCTVSQNSTKKTKAYITKNKPLYRSIIGKIKTIDLRKWWCKTNVNNKKSFCK